MKFLHTMGAIGLMGAMACFLVLLGLAFGPTSTTEHATIVAAMDAIGRWIFLPSLGLTLIAGLLAIALNRAFHSAGWAWAKLASGILIFEGSFTAVLGPIQDAAEQGAGTTDVAALTADLGHTRNALWVLLAVGAANVVLGIWRPRLTRLPD